MVGGLDGLVFDAVIWVVLLLVLRESFLGGARWGVLRASLWGGGAFVDLMMGYLFMIVLTFLPLSPSPSLCVCVWKSLRNVLVILRLLVLSTFFSPLSLVFKEGGKRERRRKG